MQSIIKSAMEGGKKRPVRDISSEFDKELEKILQSHRTVIKVVGTGGAGNNTVNRLMELGVKDVETIAINTDAQDLLYAVAHKKILIGKTITNGLGAGSDPQIGEESAKENEEDIRSAIGGSDMVFVTCGLGGGTGSGSAPIVAEIARDMGALTIAIVTIPFSEEGVLRWKNAQFGLERLKKAADTVIVIQNDKLWEIAPDVPLNDAFKLSDEILVNGVLGITDLVMEKGLVNLDFADVRMIMKDGGTAMIGLGESDSANRAVEAVEMAIQNPLVDLDVVGARSALMNIMGGSDMSVKDAKTAMQTLAKKLDPNARIIWGARINPDLNNAIRVMIIATGLRERSQGHEPNRHSEGTSKEHVLSEDEFQINETENSGESGSQKSEGAATDADSSGKTKKVFQEILEEESESDVQIFKDALEQLRKDIQNWDAWEDLKNAASAMSGTAQLFDFYEVSRFMADVEDTISVVQAREQTMPGNFLDILAEVPGLFLGMARAEVGKVQRAGDVQAKLLSLKEFMEITKDLSFEMISKKVDEIILTLAGAAGDSTESKKKQQNNLEGGRIQSVNDAVKYVNNLLKGM